MSKKRFVVDSEKSATGIVPGNRIDKFTVKIPKNVLPKKPVAMELIDYSADLVLEIIGESNNKFDIIRNGITHHITVSDVKYTSPSTLESEINTAIQTALGITTLGLIVTRIVNFSNTQTYSITQRYRYNFVTTDSIPFVLDFDIENSFGPLAGYGRTTTELNTSHDGYGINVFNQQLYELSYSATIPQQNINNRIQLLNDAGALVRDVIVTNSLFYFNDITILLEFVASQLNLASGSFSPNALFKLTHNDKTGRVTIENTTGALFQIRFNIGTYGSMHDIFGFRRTTYNGKNTYTGEPINLPPLFFPESYVYVCSNLVNSSDSSPIIMGDAGAQNKDILFVVPGDKKYYKELPSRQLVDIRSSKINTNFLKTDNDDNFDVEFYLRTFSGLHVSFMSKWVFSFNMYFDDNILDGIKQQKMLILNSNFVENGFPYNFDITIPAESFATPPISIELLNSNFRVNTDILTSDNNKFNIIRDNVTYSLALDVSSLVTSSSGLYTLINNELTAEIGQFNPGGGPIQRISVSISTFVQSNSSSEINTVYGSIFTFTANDSVPFQIDFTVDDSLGPLVGFAKTETLTATSVDGNITKEISDIFGTLVSYNADPNSALNLNNSFELLDDNKTFIAKISLTAFTTYSDTGVFLTAIRDAMNVYTASFTPNAVFAVYYDHETNSVVIENASTAKFGLVFNFTGFGSLADILGFSDQPSRYLHKTRYVGRPTEFFPRTRDETDIYITSKDLARGIDEVTVPLQGSGTTESSILFSIPGKYNNITRSAFTTSSNVYDELGTRQIINLESTKFSSNIKAIPKQDTTVNFKLKLASGSGIHLDSEWSTVMIVRS